MDRHPPIAEHGLIGDLHTAALVGVDGTIDWYCPPDFDSPSVFAAILDRTRGGGWRIAPRGGGWTSKQLYFPDTNILITRFLSPDGVGELQDFMPIASSPAHPPHSLIRRVLCVRGSVEFETEFEPRFDYGRQRHEPHLHERGAIFESPGLTLALASPRPLALTGAGARTAFTLSPGKARRSRSCPQSGARRRHRSTSGRPASPSRTPSRTGELGSAGRDTRGAGARWCTARR